MRAGTGLAGVARGETNRALYFPLFHEPVEETPAESPPHDAILPSEHARRKFGQLA